MKTIREYIDQLDEISRRDFLKGAGAAAGLAALGGISKEANAQQIGYWADYAVKLALSVMPKISQETGYDLRNYIYKNVHAWITDYCAQTNSYNAKNVIDYCNEQAYESSGLKGSSFLGNAFLRDMKATVDNFLHAYRAALIEKIQEFNNQVRAQQQQKQAMGGLTENEVSILADALLLYAITKEDNHPSHKQIAQALGQFIQAYNNKDYVNSMYAKVKPSLDQVRSNPNLFAQEKNKFYSRANSIVSNLNSLSAGKQPEFKESEEDLEETASPDAVKRIEQLVQYK